MSSLHTDPKHPEMVWCLATRDVWGITMSFLHLTAEKLHMQSFWRWLRTPVYFSSSQAPILKLKTFL